REVERATRRFISLLTAVHQRRSEPAKEAEFRRAGLALSHVLGLEQQTSAQSERILVVPDGILHRLPFATVPALLGKSGRKPMGLIADVFQVPSVAVFTVLANRDQKFGPDARALVIGDPVYNITDSRFRK